LDNAWGFLRSATRKRRYDRLSGRWVRASGPPDANPLIRDPVTAPVTGSGTAWFRNGGCWHEAGMPAGAVRRSAFEALLRAGKLAGVARFDPLRIFIRLAYWPGIGCRMTPTYFVVEEKQTGRLVG